MSKAVLRLWLQQAHPRPHSWASCILPGEAGKDRDALSFRGRQVKEARDGELG